MQYAPHDVGSHEPGHWATVFFKGEEQAVSGPEIPPEGADQVSARLDRGECLGVRQEAKRFLRWETAADVDDFENEIRVGDSPFDDIFVEEGGG